MSATTAQGAAPPLAAGEEIATAVVDQQEAEQKAADAKEATAEVDADDTTDVSDEETVVAEEVPASGEDLRPIAEAGSHSAALSQEERETSARREAAARVRQSAALPPGLRERLAALVESGGQVGGEGQALIPIDAAIRAVAESLPSAARLGGDEVSRPEHPGGEAFFSGRTAEEITDLQAEELARGQLARSGLLRGQRVRVAD